ncbi:MAG TPA: DUF6484 domain-containing protein, partial [Chloroflexota bacterium]
MSTVENDIVESRAVPSSRTSAIHGVVTGTLIGFKDEGQTPLVLFPGQCSTTAVSAASTVDLHGAHIGRRVVMMFENG